TSGVSPLVTVEQKDPYAADLSKATVLMLDVPPAVLDALRPQIARMKGGSRIVTTARFPGVFEADSARSGGPDLYVTPLEEDDAVEAAPPAKPAPSPQPSASVPKPEQRPDVVYVPTPQAVVEKMLELANVQANEVVFDLGSGDGRIPITAAKKFGARGFGYD